MKFNSWAVLIDPYIKSFSSTDEDLLLLSPLRCWIEKFDSTPPRTSKSAAWD